MKILVLGASGMIGSAMLRVLAERDDWEVIGAVRSESARAHFSTPVAERMVCGTDLLAGDMLARLFATTRPDVVVNCAGLTKHLPAGNEPLPAIEMNALLPHRLAPVSYTHLDVYKRQADWWMAAGRSRRQWLACSPGPRVAWISSRRQRFVGTGDTASVF